VLFYRHKKENNSKKSLARRERVRDLQSANGRFANYNQEREVQSNGRRTVLLLET